MDLLYFDARWSVLICISCQYALLPCAIGAHLQNLHKTDRLIVKECTKHWGAVGLGEPRQIQQLEIPAETVQIPHIAFYRDGIRCRLCLGSRPYICRSSKVMRRHLRQTHDWQNGRACGRVPASSILSEGDYSNVTTAPVCCQTFYQLSRFIRYFEVQHPSSAYLLPALDRPTAEPEEEEEGMEKELLRQTKIKYQVHNQLAQRLQMIEQDLNATGLKLRTWTQADPWLDITMWEKYLQGHKLHAAARLKDLPQTQSGLVADRQLCLILAAFDRLIEQTRTLILQGEVNVFDLHRVNNFVSRYGSIKVVMTKLEKRAMLRPLLSKLQEDTYKKYKRVWKRLICFVYRLVYKKQQPALHYTLTETQSKALECLIRATEILNSKILQGSDCSFGLLEPLQRGIDQACLHFCVALLDHHLLGPIHDSVIVGFIAVQGIDVKKNGFHEAPCYTTYLSALVKMAQLLVLRRAIAAKEAGECEHPAQALEEMQERFMVYNTRSPMNWIQKLRTYGKRISETTTGLGHITWTEDGKELSYKGLKLSIIGLKEFVLQQINTAGAQLRSLLYMHLEEDAKASLPDLNLEGLKDNAALKTPGWSFLCDPRNTALQGYERWLLHRVVDTDRLRKDFFIDIELAQWSRPVAERYLKQVDAFLERLLLIAQLVSGQPARGSELMSLQYCNTVNCRRRNIFLENGLISFVTFYHKGYSVESCVKIIHRYLPEEVSKLVVYYLWLVLPFANQLRLLALDQPATATSSPYLWSQPHKTHDDAGQYSPWPSSRLSHVLKEEFQTHLHTKANIQIWRHAAIAISRRHLRQAKFRKDFDIGAGPVATWNDAQACHAADLAASVYARGIEEAPGHTEQARAEYRQISREWHGWLGVGPVPANPLPIFGKGFLGVKPGAKRPTTWLDAQAGHTTDTAERIYARIGSSGSSLKRKALSDMSGSQIGKKAMIREEDGAESVIRGFLEPSHSPKGLERRGVRGES